jgi:hypothetical protein
MRKSSAQHCNYFHTTMNRIINKGKQIDNRQSTCYSTPWKICLEKNIISVTNQSDKELVRSGYNFYNIFCNKVQVKKSPTFNISKEVTN